MPNRSYKVETDFISKLKITCYWSSDKLLGRKGELGIKISTGIMKELWRWAECLQRKKNSI